MWCVLCEIDASRDPKRPNARNKGGNEKKEVNRCKNGRSGECWPFRHTTTDRVEAVDKGTRGRYILSCQSEPNRPWAASRANVDRVGCKHSRAELSRVQ